MIENEVRYHFYLATKIICLIFGPVERCGEDFTLLSPAPLHSGKENKIHVFVWPSDKSTFHRLRGWVHSTHRVCNKISVRISVVIMVPTKLRLINFSLNLYS